MFHLNKSQAFVFFRNPFEQGFKYLSGSWSKINNIQDCEKGFIMAPFNLNEESIYQIQGEPKNLDSLPNDLDELLGWDTVSSQKILNKSNYKELVSGAVSTIKKGEFDKLVLSRKEKVKLPKKFKLREYLERVSNAYPECFVYIFYIPKVCCWLGASPEILGKSAKNREFHTIALAGTMSQNQILAGQNWGEKEIIEQAMVTSFILDKLKSFNPGNLKSLGPENAETGELVHLKTIIMADIPEEKKLTLIHALHPTPAVSGLPQKKAIDYILKNEGYNREFYSGFSGIIQDKSTFEFYVNLRCMQLSKEEAILYAGAGITSDSIPEKEYIETSNKLNALKRIINAASNTL